MTPTMPFFRLYETSVIFDRKDTFSGITEKPFIVNKGSRLIFSLYVESLDPSASVQVDILNTFHGDIPFQNVLSFSTNVAGYTTRVLTDTHCFFVARVTVSGGDVTNCKLGITIADNSMMTRIENAVVEVALSHFAGIDGKSDSVRIGDGIDELAINPDGSINANIFHLIGAPLNLSFVGEAISGTQKELITYTVPTGKISLINAMYLTCRKEGTAVILKNGVHIWSGRTGAASINIDQKFSPIERLVEGDIVKVLFTQESYRADNGKVEAYLRGQLI